MNQLAPAESLGLEEEPPKKNCNTCRFSGALKNNCYMLTLDEETDWPILKWLEGPGALREDGTVPLDVDGCPAWRGT